MGKRNLIWKKTLALFLVLAIFMPLLPVGMMEVSAEGPKQMDFRQHVNDLKLMYGEFETPFPKFDVIFEDGETHFIEPTFEENQNPYSKFNNVELPISERTIKVGETIKVKDKSVLGSGDTMKAWDWQVMYRDKNGESYRNTFHSWKKEAPNIPAPTQEGWIEVYLSVADNYEIYKGMKYPNHNTNGNWYTDKVWDGYSDNPDKNVRGWYFTRIRIKVQNEPVAKQDVILTDMAVYEKSDVPRQVASFKRILDPQDPLNSKKEIIKATNTKPEDAFLMDRDKKYFVIAKYQF